MALIDEYLSSSPTLDDVMCAACGYRGEQREPYSHDSVCASCRHSEPHAYGRCESCDPADMTHPFQRCPQS
jgi:hypothetical protein